MEAWVTTVVSIAVSALVSGIVGYIVKRSLDNLFKKRDRESAQKEAEQAELIQLREQKLREERIQDFNQALIPIKSDIQEMKKDIKLNNEASLCTLRNDILTCYYRCNEKGYRSDNDFTNLHDMFNAYKGLEGNSFVEDVVSRFDSLQTKEEHDKKLKTKKSKTVINEEGK